MFGLFEKSVPPDSSRGPWIIFDIGGTKMRVAVARNESNFDTPEIGETPSTYPEALKMFESLARKALGDRTPQAICGGVAGTLMPDHQEIFKSPNLSSWSHKPLANDLSSMFGGVPVTIENDAALVGLGEASVGAGEGFPIVMYVTVSTGVGGARIVDGYIDRSAVGFEPGHQIIDMHTGEDLESLVSGKAVEKRFGVKPYDLADVTKREVLADELSIGLGNSILHWSPDVLVLGGSLIAGKLNTLPLDRIEKRLKERLTRLPKIPQIRKSMLGDLGGLSGALALVRQYH